MSAAIAARVRTVVAGLLAASSLAACVHDVIIDDRPVAETGSGDDGCTETGCAGDGIASKGDGDGNASGSGGGDGSDGNGGSTTTIGDPDTTGATGDGGNTTTTGGPVGAAPCTPCAADSECGGDFDGCVELVVSDPRCLAVCKEPPAQCAEGFSCMATVSVDGARVMQCVPDAGQCS